MNRKAIIEEPSCLHSLIVIALITLILSGCAPTIAKMAPNRKDTQMFQSQKALILLSLKIEHPVKPTMQPKATMIYLFAEPEGRYIFSPVDEDACIQGSNDSEYLLRIPLPAGHYHLRTVEARNGNFISTGTGYMPILGDFEVKPGAVIYLGRVEGRTRERKNDEFRAGLVTPIMDQSFRGWSESTWDVVIKDAADADLPLFRAAFPALNGVNIDKQILPPFDRQKAQSLWEKSVHGFIQR
jgi:hypothetical protein